MTAPAGIDPRGPRFAAAITNVLLLVTTFLGLTGLSTARDSIASFGWFAYLPLADVTLTLTDSPSRSRCSSWGVVSPSTAPRGAVPPVHLPMPPS